jgi:UDP-3-O-[3-hydroxymyristoyl] glucosamine N-acyltransferase
MQYRLGELAAAVKAELRGNPGRLICGLATLEDASPDQLGFLAMPLYRKYLRSTRAAAVVLRPEDAPGCPVDCLIVADPYVCFARISRLFQEESVVAPGIHPAAVVSDAAFVHPEACIGPFCTVDANAVIGARTTLGPGCHIGRGARLGADCRLVARVTLYPAVSLGDRVLAHAGVVIGSDGFGFAAGEGGWEKLAQLGSVSIGDDVEIGAGSTVDRGTLGDTVLGRGVKIDNQVQIAHNVQIGEHTAIAGCAGIAGSVRIGAHCRIGGGAGLVGHIEIADHVTITAMSLVTRSITQQGVYSSGTTLQKSARWRRSALRFTELDDIARRLARLERKADNAADNQQEQEPPPC